MEAPPQSSPHDRFIKGMLQYPEAAADFFRCLLPVALWQGIEIDTLVTETGSYVSTELRAAYSDLLFSCRLRGQSGLLYFLIEHQRQPDRQIALRMADYCVQALLDWRKANPKAHDFPVLDPIVFHQGDRPWAAPTDLLGLAGIDDDRRREIAAFAFSPGFLVIDLCALDLAAMRGGLLLMFLLGLMRAAAEGNQAEWLVEHEAGLTELLGRPDGSTILRMMLRYVYCTKPKTSNSSTWKQLADRVNSRAIRTEIMTWYDAVIQEGLEQGLERGRRDGLIGQLQLCERFLGRRQRAATDWQGLSIEQLEAELGRLKEEIDRFGSRS